MDRHRNSNTPSDRFDPFADRLARDIRNQLSEAFITSVRQMTTTPLTDGVGNLSADHLAEVYRSYITSQMVRYQNVLDQIHSKGLNEIWQQVVIIWNHQLFFEVHELLESLWQPSRGDRRQALKGLIQAAGVYVHLGRNHQKAAAGLAKRAIGHLEQCGDQLSHLQGIRDLIHKLHRLDRLPPHLNLIKDDYKMTGKP